MPESNVAAVTLTPKELPLPLSVPEVAESASQALLAEAVQVTGREQVPVSIKASVWGGAVACPSGRVKLRLAGEAGASTQGGSIVRVTSKVCGLPCTVAPVLSVAAMVTWVL